MKPWEIRTWNFPNIGPHPAVILGTEDRVGRKPRVNVLLCSTQRAARQPEASEVLLDQSDGLNWETLCKCDIVYMALAAHLTQRRGLVSTERRRPIGERVIRGLGLAGL
jgi:hypothetical protein